MKQYMNQGMDDIWYNIIYNKLLPDIYISYIFEWRQSVECPKELFGS